MTRIRIDGFRSIRSAELNLQDTTVLIGANGAGKSNFIGFLQMLGYMMNESLSLYVNERRGANALLHFGSERTRALEAQIHFEGGGQSYTYGFSLIHASGDRLLYLQEGMGFTSPGVANSRAFSTGGFEPELPKIARLEKLSEYSAALRLIVGKLSEIKVFHFHNTTPASAIRGHQSLRESRSLLEQGGNLAVILYRLRLEHPRHYGRIVEEMKRVLPEFRDFVLNPDPFRDEEQIELRWVSHNSTSTFGPDQLSDGSLRAAALLTLLLQPDEFKPEILVIDEPELGLHPFAVGQIGRLIAEAGLTRQVIVSTQSSQLLSQFDLGDIVVVESENGASQFRRLNQESLETWMETYDNDLGRLFEMNVLGGAPS